jgi:predicted membrane chloride channel (bestrophin family)
MAKVKMTEDQFIKEWELTRRKGFYRYIIIQGGVSWGIFSGLIYIVLLMIANIFMELPPENSLAMNKGFQMFLFVVFGMLLGVVIWFRNEKRYLKRKPYNKTIRNIK